jgi:hypothetical protein
MAAGFFTSTTAAQFYCAMAKKWRTPVASARSGATDFSVYSTGGVITATTGLSAPDLYTDNSFRLGFAAFAAPAGVTTGMGCLLMGNVSGTAWVEVDSDF